VGRKNVAEQQETILAAMKKAGKPMKPGEIAERTGIDQKEVAKIIDTLKKEGKVASPKRCYWEPSK
jgi:DNA-binding MarR family transcriptional regulator